MRLLPTSSRQSPSIWKSAATSALLFSSSLVSAIDLDLNSPDSIKQAAGTIANNLWSYYKTTTVPGNLPQPYYWWEAGAMMMTMIDYWYYTGDSQYNDGITEALLWQTGPDNNYMTPNQTKTEGNDDQAFWGFAALDAAELRFPNPPSDKPQWLALAQAVFNTQVPRWDAQHCGGGLRWQIFQFNAGWNYKNLISNGCYFSLAARLARYTGNQTYADYAQDMYNWITDIGLVDDKFNCYDGSDVAINCTTINRVPFSYSAGVMLHGAANMWNYTQDPKWKTIVDGFVQGIENVFVPPGGVMMEVACEPIGTCNNDQRSFKAYLSRWMAATTQLAPWTADTIMPILQKSAAAAASKGCATGQCVLTWTDKGASSWAGKYGPGENMAAMSVIASNLIGGLPGPVTADKGGLSKGDPGAGTGSSNEIPLPYSGQITTADRAGAGILTALVMVFIIGGAWWMVGGLME